MHATRTRLPLTLSLLLRPGLRGAALGRLFVYQLAERDAQVLGQLLSVTTDLHLLVLVQWVTKVLRALEGKIASARRCERRQKDRKVFEWKLRKSHKIGQ